MRRFALFSCALFLSLAPQQAVAAETRWIRSSIGTLDVVSDAPAKQTLDILGTFEEFRFALGESVGKKDMNAHPPLRLFVSKQRGEATTPILGRDRYVIPLTAEGGIPPAAFRAATRLLLQQNVTRLPAGIASGMETFFSTIEVHGAHVVWGAPPPSPERTLDWARIHLLATKPEYYGKLKILLFNLRNGIEEDPAFRNAIGKSASEFSREADAYWKAGVFGTADGPSRPLNARHDFKVEELSDFSARLARADFLDGGSEREYKALIKENRLLTEDYEGLAMLSLRAGDADAAKDYLAQATDAGSDNAQIWVEYAKVGPNRGESVAKALELDPNNAEAHYLAGLQKDDPEQLKIAAGLAPQNVGYWDELAQSYVGKGKYPEAGRAWRSAELAATDPAQREVMRQRWLGIENRKLDFEDNEKRRTADEKQQDINRLKTQALADLHAAEAKFNGKAAADPNVPVVPWDDVFPVHFEGMLKQVDCLGKLTRIVLETADGKPLKLAVKNRKGLACGPANVHAAFDYDRKSDAKLGTAGELESFPQ